MIPGNLEMGAASCKCHSLFAHRSALWGRWSAGVVRVGVDTGRGKVSLMDRHVSSSASSVFFTLSLGGLSNFRLKVLAIFTD